MDYSKAKIYKILNSLDNEIYVGSTCCNLSTRMAKHRYRAKEERSKNHKLYQKMNEVGQENFTIILLEEFKECQNIEQLRKKEREKIEELKPVLNNQVPTRTYQEWIQENHEHKKEMDRQLYQQKREERIEYQKQYAQENPDKVKAYKQKWYEKKKQNLSK